jgi:hypothetical protein
MCVSSPLNDPDSPENPRWINDEGLDAMPKIIRQWTLYTLGIGLTKYSLIVTGLSDP